ncbi:MAG: hypothetical protein JSR82_19365 [Verrucomicrobia bacterium]|nr:hypothetical protein [Verrucomicrobiota bacterium]
MKQPSRILRVSLWLCLATSSVGLRSLTACSVLPGPPAFKDAGRALRLPTLQTGKRIVNISASSSRWGAKTLIYHSWSEPLVPIEAEFVLRLQKPVYTESIAFWDFC